MLVVGLLALSVAVKAQNSNTPAPTYVEAPGIADNNADKDAPKIVFEQTTIDYGTIEHNADGDRYFKFKNTGKKPLIITGANGSCSCTVPEYPREPIAPGKTGQIKVHYATDHIGAINRTVTIFSNSSTPTVVLTIKGMVLSDLKPVPQQAKSAR